MSKKPPPFYVTWLNAVQDDPRSTSMTQAVAHALFRNINWKRREGYPSQALLAVKVRTTIRTVQSEISKLKKCGLLDVACGKNRRKGNLYRPIVPGHEQSLFQDRKSVV